MRIISVQGLNMRNLKGYADLMERAEPSYKTCMHVGFSRRRLGYQNMPSRHAVRRSSDQLATGTGYGLVDESEESRVVLLSKLKGSRKLGEGE